MLSLAHFGLLVAFIFIGALGMAAMQDGLEILWRHLGLGRRVRTCRPGAGRTPWIKPSLR